MVDQRHKEGAAAGRYLLICFILSWTGGFADAGSCVLIGTFTGHVTGNALLAAINAVQNNYAQTFACVLAVVIFLAATALGAIWLRHSMTSSCRRLALPLAVETLVIALGVFTSTPDTDFGKGVFLVCLCFALGVQNGVLSKFGPVSVHSTYITGMSTTLVTSIRDWRWEAQWIVPTLVIACFLVGAFCGALLSHQAGLRGFAFVLLPYVMAFGAAVTAPKNEGK